jgi:septal ring factor EnvC (AmiA/AmiB activator)
LTFQANLPNLREMSTTVGELPGGGARRRFARPLLAVGVVAALVATALAVRSDLEVRHQTHAASVTAARLARERRGVVHEIDRRRHELADAQQQLAGGRRTLGLLDTQVASVRKELAAREQDLEKAQHNVADTRTRISEQRARIGALGQCLNGVGSALNALAVGDDHSAVSSLEYVAAACQQAAAQIPGIGG